MPSTTQLGPFTIWAVEAGRFRLDGGAMFGVVPKTLWSRKIEADEKNRIPMAMRLMLIRSENSGKLYLVDTGSGTKFNEKMESIYALDYEHSNLVDSLAACGFTPEDVTDIIFSHLHFDHCGGTTYYDGEKLKHRFPNAIYHVNKNHLETANNPNAREKASFFDDNIGPISQSERLNKVDDLQIYEEGLSTIPAYGHTAGQQLPVIEGDGKTLIFGADLIPTYAHIPLPWVMGYDMMPVQTLKEKEAFLKEAAENGWYIFLEHDAHHEVVTVKQENGKYEMGESLTLGDL